MIYCQQAFVIIMLTIAVSQNDGLLTQAGKMKLSQLFSQLDISLKGMTA
jgi:hypothetical protein